MPSFLEQYIRQIQIKSQRFGESFTALPRNETEERLQDGVIARWNDLPPTASGAARRPAFAVDGSSAMRPLMNGATFLVCQSLLVGGGLEESLVFVELVRGGDGRDAGRALDRLRQYAEFRVAADHLDRMAGGLLLVDGSLLSDLSHMLYLRPLRLGEFTDLRAALMGAYLDLLDGCRERDILLVGISKSARDTLLMKSLVDEAAPGTALCDAEILHRFTGGRPGYTQPILFGTDGTAARPEDGGDSHVEATFAKRLSDLPCIGVFYIRLAGGEDALRVDVMGNAIGREERLLDFQRAWAPSESAADLVACLRGQHGGPNVYNAPLYTADRMVRLAGQMVDGPYMALLREASGAMVAPDRSTRRFVGRS